jgi:hypothetical protein
MSAVAAATGLSDAFTERTDEPAAAHSHPEQRPKRRPWTRPLFIGTRPIDQVCTVTDRQIGTLGLGPFNVCPVPCDSSVPDWRPEGWSMRLFRDRIGRVRPEDGVYVARYGWNRRSGTLIAGAAVFVLIAVAVPMSLVLQVVTIVFFGGGALLFIGSIATRRVALRVDAVGVTLGGSPARYRSTTSQVPWADIREVVLWRQPMPYGRSMLYVGLARRHGARPLAGRRGQRASQVASRALAPQISAGTLLASRAVNLWRLDVRRMTAAVAHFAPHVRVVDRDTGQVISHTA